MKIGDKVTLKDKTQCTVTKVNKKTLTLNNSIIYDIKSGTPVPNKYIWIVMVNDMGIEVMPCSSKKKALQLFEEKIQAYFDSGDLASHDEIYKHYEDLLYTEEFDDKDPKVSQEILIKILSAKSDSKYIYLTTNGDMVTISINKYRIR